MENAKSSSSSWFTAFGREGSSPFSCTAVILVILYIQEWRGVGCRLEKVSQWAIQIANVCNCVKHTLPTGMENAGKEIGRGMENAGKEIGGGELVGHSNC